MRRFCSLLLSLFVVLLVGCVSVSAFSSPLTLPGCRGVVSAPGKSFLRMSSSNDNDFTISSESDQVLLGTVGTVASLVTLYSEFTLKTTGCGLPAGPLGLVGAVEGISYLGIVGIASVSLFKKLKTGSGLPAGPGGILGAAEGLSFLAIVAGLAVLGFQIADYGYIPNAVPMEGGMCK